MQKLRGKFKKRKTYRSSTEEKLAKIIAELGIKCGYETYPVQYSVEETRTYRPDFIFKKKKGGYLLLEVKGWFKSKDRTKYEYVLKSNPKIDLRFLFEKDNYLYTGSKKRYSDWAKKLKVPYCIGLELPQEWLKEIDFNG